MTRKWFAMIRKFPQWSLSVLVAAILLTMLLARMEQSPVVHAETTDFGGFPDRFLGNGDNEPPTCQVNHPNAATEPFFIKWDCTDDVAKKENIRSALWILRPDATRMVKISDFMGFPASVEINHAILQVTQEPEDNFTDGLPLSFKLEAMDTAGNTAMSDTYTILAQDNSVDTCDLSIITAGTDSVGGTTGEPSLSVVVTDADVTSVQLSTENLRIYTPEKVKASTCNIESICSDNSELIFDSSFTLADSTATGTIFVVPGNVESELEGTTSGGAELRSLTASGTATIDGADAAVTLICTKS